MAVDGSVPVQRVGISIGEGPAQVFSYPEISKAIDFGRQQKLLEQREQMVKDAEQRKATRERVDAALLKLTDAKGWVEHEKYNQELNEKVTKTINGLYDNMDAYANGDPEALRSVALNVNEVVRLAEKRTEQKKQYASALAFLNETPGRFSPEHRDDILALGEGKKTVEELAEKDEFWYYPDQIDLNEMELSFRKENPDLVYNSVSEVKPVARGLLQVTKEKVVSDYTDALTNWINSDPERQTEVIVQMTRRGIPKEDAIKTFVEERAALLGREVETTFQRFTPPSSRGGGSKDETPESILADTLIADSQRATVSKDPEFLQKYVAGSGYIVDWSNGNFTFQNTDKSASGNQDDAIIIPDHDHEGIARTITELVDLDPESVRKGQPADEAEINDMTSRINKLNSDLEKIPSTVKVGDIGVDLERDLLMLNNLEGVSVSESGLIRKEIIVTIEGQGYDMTVPKERAKAIRLLRRKALNSTSSGTKNPFEE